jgi:hypothetical protein
VKRDNFTLFKTYFVLTSMREKTGFGGKMLKEYQLEDLGIDGRKLEAIIKKENGRLWDGFFWLRI